ncbi:GPW/gp25 family protein [Dysgonomonas sp. 511]|uniref:GPW/gp25 family protein n=1 Tax=Dysgonomonas sp. 511 TaxID=2302930 RepID=UPI0013D5C6DA|nr:GPW/gp25 family protein [Dysgonomonas sp. 511]NDV78484.1 type VI secretion system baseplate protein TssE [Dysgonomonas sp. 511]
MNSHRNYKLPINFDSVFDEDGKKMSTCSEVSSIDQYIELLLTTCPGEHKFDKQFGCRIWDMDFERVVSRKKWEDDFAAHILNAVQTYEKRLKDVSVTLNIQEVSRQDYTLQTTAIKKEVKVYIRSRLVSNNEPCKFQYALFLGPLSTE